ncbi:hypothetical protein [Streptomyces sp. NPDC047070]|uniref:hypothetical protein n=1 Tax=Streptomyces sp. NPDC047070 TaxID=3154923 RepID=UPI0034553834
MSLVPSLSSNPDHPGRQYALGQELRVSVLTAAEETEGRHDVTDSFMLAGAATPLHAHTRYEERLWVSAGLLTVWAGDEKPLHRPVGVPDSRGQRSGVRPRSGARASR